MKHDAISRHELPKLIHTLKEHGTFTGQRGGRQVRMSIQPKIWGNEVAYSVSIHRREHLGTAATVGAAVDEVNRIIKHSSAT